MPAKKIPRFVPDDNARVIRPPYRLTARPPTFSPVTQSFGPDVLVVRFSAIGDILLTTPLLRAIRTRHPGARISVLTKQPYVPLLSHNPYVSEVLAVAPHDGLPAIAERIRAVRYSHLLDLHGSLRSRALRRLAPGDWKFYDKRSLERGLLILSKWDRYRADVPVAERYFEAAQELEVEPDGGPPDFFISEEADCRADERLVALDLGRERPIVAIAPGAAHATKRWPIEHWVELIGRITPTGADVAILGGPDDTGAAGIIVDAAGPNVASLAGQLGLQETGAVIRRSEVLISGDTGVMHMATGVGTPVVALFGPTARQFGFFPYRSPSRVVELALPCRPCSAHGSRSCPLGHHNCLRQITPDMVYPALAEALA